MTAAPTRTYRLGEFHAFEGGGRQFLYLVPAGAIFELDTAAATVISLLSEGAATPEELMEKLTQRDFAAADAAELIQEMFLARVIVTRDSTSPAREPVEDSSGRFPVADSGDESHQSMQLILPVLLRIRRGQSGHARRQTEVHGPSNRQGLGGFPA